MSNHIENLKRNRTAAVIGLLALFIAIGGTATAAGLINGKNIKKGTVTNKQFKNQTITVSRINPETAAFFRNSQGPKGETGENGAKGDSGLQGIQGGSGVKTFSASNTKTNQPANTNTDMVIQALPGSRYIINAKVNVTSTTAGSTVTCRIEASNGGGSDEAKWLSPANGARGTLSMALSTSPLIGQAKVVCNPGNSTGSFTTDLVSIQAA